jgi:hypothetical protein
MMPAGFAQQQRADFGQLLAHAVQVGFLADAARWPLHRRQGQRETLEGRADPGRVLADQVVAGVDADRAETQVETSSSLRCRY